MEWADGYNTVFNFTVIFILAWMEEGQLINFWAPNNQHNVISVKSLQISRCTLDEVHAVSFTDTRAATHSATLPPQTDADAVLLSSQTAALSSVQKD